MTTSAARSSPAGSGSAGRRVGSPLGRVRHLGRVAALGLRGLTACVRPPFSALRQTPGALASAVLAAAPATALIVVTWTVAVPGVALGNFVAVNGQEDRLGGLLLAESLRWGGPVFALLGLAISAGGRLTARLAAGSAERGEAGGEAGRVGALVGAQVLAFGLAGVLLATLSAALGTGGGALVSAVVFDVPLGVLADSLFAVTRFADLALLVVEAALAGALVGLLCCFAGLEATGSDQDGARAVRRALVGSLVAIAFVTVTLGAYGLGAFPDLRFSR